MRGGALELLGVDGSRVEDITGTARDDRRRGVTKELA
jgi:hypothetical protein